MRFSQEKAVITMIESHEILHIDAHEAFNIQAFKLIVYFKNEANLKNSLTWILKQQPKLFFK